MSDEEYFEQLCSNSIDGTLTDSEREKLEAHLAECPSCAALKEDLEQMRALFAEEAEPPAGLHESIMQRLEQESKLKVVQPEKPVRRMPVFTMVAAAAAVVLVVLGGGLMPMFSTVSGGSTAASTASTADGSAAAPETDVSGEVQEAAGEAGLAQEDATAVAGESQTEGAASSAPFSVTPEPQAEPGDTAGGSTAPAAQSEPKLAEVQPSQEEPADGAAADPESGSSEPSGGNAPQAMTSENVAKTVTVPESLRTVAVSHCYIAQGGGELPDIGGKLLATDGKASWFLLDNDLSTLQDTLNAVEEAGFTVSGYEGAGLTIDSKATSWLLAVVGS